MSPVSIPVKPFSTPASSSPALPLLQAANRHLVVLTDLLETFGTGEANLSKATRDKALHMNTLSQLKADLVIAMNVYRIVCQENAPLDNQLMKKTDLLWRCDQCNHYLYKRRYASKALALLSPERSRGQWQIRKTLSAITRLKLLTHVRKFIPGPNTLSLSWQELLPGLRLWLLNL